MNIATAIEVHNERYYPTVSYCRKSKKEITEIYTTKCGKSGCTNCKWTNGTRNIRKYEKYKSSYEKKKRISKLRHVREQKLLID